MQSNHFSEPVNQAVRFALFASPEALVWGWGYVGGVPLGVAIAAHVIAVIWVISFAITGLIWLLSDFDRLLTAFRRVSRHISRGPGS